MTLPINAGPERQYPLSSSCEKHRAAIVDTVKWRAIKNVRPVQCHECVMYLHDNKLTLPFPLGSRWERKGSTGVLYLCRGHAAWWRSYDGVE